MLLLFETMAWHDTIKLFVFYGANKVGRYNNYFY